MKRFLICALGVAMLATPAMAQQPDVTYWIQGADNGNKITLGISETAIIQLWMSIGTAGGNQPVVGLDLFLTARDALGVIGSENFEVVSFNNQVITDSQSQRLNRGAEYTDGTTNLPGSLNLYQFVIEDAVIEDPAESNGIDASTYPRTGATAILLDEIIIHGLRDNTGVGSDLVHFNITNTPNFFYIKCGLFGCVSEPAQNEGGIALGTGNGGSIGTMLTVNVTPEPATLGLLALGGLAAFRRRR